VLVGNCVGFTANRIFFPYGQAAGLLMDHGVDAYRIDQALEKWGMPMGVGRMADLSGVDISIHVTGIIQSAYSDRTYSSTINQRLVKAGRLGQKTGVGYYKYVKGKPVADPQGLAPLVQAARQDAGSPVLPEPLTDAQLVEVLLLPVVNESYRVLAEGHVIRASDVDMCAILGYGFPAFTGGVMFWAQMQGLDKVRVRLQHYADTFGKNNPKLAAFFKPCDMLVKEAAKKK